MYGAVYGMKEWDGGEAERDALWNEYPSHLKGETLIVYEREFC